MSEQSKPMFPPNTCACNHPTHLGQCPYCPTDEPCIITMEKKPN